MGLLQEVFALKKDINIQIGNRIRKAREQANLSRDALAERLNISTLFLGYIECGQKGMSLTTLQNLCIELGVSADYILLGIETPCTHRENIYLMLDKIDDQYVPLIETQVRSIIYAIKKIEEINSSALPNKSIK